MKWILIILVMWSPTNFSPSMAEKSFLLTDRQGKKFIVDGVPNETGMYSKGLMRGRKKSFFLITRPLRPYPPPLELSDQFFFELNIFFSWWPGPHPRSPLSGRATKKKEPFDASLRALHRLNMGGPQNRLSSPGIQFTLGKP